MMVVIRTTGHSHLRIRTAPQERMQAYCPLSISHYRSLRFRHSLELRSVRVAEFDPFLNVGESPADQTGYAHRRRYLATGIEPENLASAQRKSLPEGFSVPKLTGFICVLVHD